MAIAWLLCGTFFLLATYLPRITVVQVLLHMNMDYFFYRGIVTNYSSIIRGHSHYWPCGGEIVIDRNTNDGCLAEPWVWRYETGMTYFQNTYIISFVLVMSNHRILMPTDLRDHCSHTQSSIALMSMASLVWSSAPLKAMKIPSNLEMKLAEMIQKGKFHNTYSLF